MRARDLAIGFIAACVLFAAGGYLFIVLGGMPIPTKSKPLPLEEAVASKAIGVYLKGSENIKPAFEATEENLVAGAKLYADHCAICHGNRSGEEPMFAKGMFPPPPQLMKDGSWEVGYPPGSVYQLIRGGIRLTGMPGFADLLTEKEIWLLTQALVNADKLPAGAQEHVK